MESKTNQNQNKPAATPNTATPPATRNETTAMPGARTADYAGEARNGDAALAPRSTSPATTTRSDQKSWLESSGLKDSLDKLPQSIKDLGSLAGEQVNKLSTTQKVVGGALLLGGIGWLTLRGKGQENDADRAYSSYSRAKDSGSRSSADSKPWGSASRTTINKQYRPTDRANSSSRYLEDDDNSSY